MKPTYDDLLLIIEAQRQTIARLEKRVAELEERLNLNSKNSSKPPSTDKKENKKAPKGGAVKGHPGHHRKLYPPEKVSQTVLSRLECCQHCGCKKLMARGVQIFQQVEIPAIEPFITQIEQEKATCTSCGKNLIASFPVGYAPTAFGPRLISFIGACSTVYRMSKRTTQELLKHLCNIDISLGSIPAMERKVSASLANAHDTIGLAARESKVVYVDETAFRECAKTHYVWTATTAQVVFLRILPTRGADSREQIRPKDSEGVTVTDRYRVYAYDKQQYCLAHIVRNINRFAQRDGPDRELGERALFELAEIFKTQKLTCPVSRRSGLYYRKRRLKTTLNEAYLYGSEGFSGLAERLLEDYEKLFCFMKHKGVDCTNNAAERSLRHIVLWRKTSYGTQSEAGSRFLERAISVWMTLKKQGRNVLSFFLQSYQATFRSGVVAPSI